MPGRAKIYLAGLVAGSSLVAIYESIVYAKGLEYNSALAAIWPTVFLVLLILWVVEDSKSQPETYRPFDFGLLTFLFWLPYLPYYLWHTRRSKGLLLLVGFIGLYFLGNLAQWAIYAVS